MRSCDTHEIALRSASWSVRLEVRRTEFCSPICHVAVNIHVLTCVNKPDSAALWLPRHLAQPRGQDSAPSHSIPHQASGASDHPSTPSTPRGTCCSQDTATDLCVPSHGELVGGVAFQGQPWGEDLPPWEVGGTGCRRRDCRWPGGPFQGAEKAEAREPNEGESSWFIMEAYKRATLSISKITKCTTFF